MHRVGLERCADIVQIEGRKFRLRRKDMLEKKIVLAGRKWVSIGGGSSVFTEKL